MPPAPSSETISYEPRTVPWTIGKNRPVQKDGPTIVDLRRNRRARPFGRASIQCEHEQIARVLQLVPVHRMQMPSAGLHGEILLRADRVSDRRTFERRADVEAPEFFERFVVVGDHPAVL